MLEQWGPCDHATMCTPRYMYPMAVGGAGFSALDLDLPDSDGACNGAFCGTGHQRSSSTWGYLYRYSCYTWCYTPWKEDTYKKIMFNGSCMNWLWAFEQLTTFKYTFHSGKVNVLSVDGSVAATDVHFLAGRVPKNNPRWSCIAD
jgi:prepilin-type processing-associated H-X9-DG protein